MKRPYFLLFLVLAISSWHCQVSDANQVPPNIILIIADDMAWDDCGAYGHPSIQTPNIDQLAKDGMLYHNAYVTASSCSPSRASIITGLFPHQTDAEQLHWPLPADKKTFVEELTKGGYWTAQAGKWHFGDFIKDRFDHIAPVNTAGFVYNAKGEASQQQTKDDGSGCQQWLPTLQRRPKDKPFFLWLAAVDPHRAYDDRTERVHQPEDVELPPYLPDNEEVRGDFVQYYDEVHRLDRYVGMVVDELEREGLSENTLVMFISDNGRPFPREKTTLYEGGIKTPWIVKWPSKIKAGTNSTALVSTIDIAPTFLKLADLPIDERLEGKDFSPTFSDPTTEIQSFVYAEDHWHDFEDYSRAILSKQFKYIRNFYPDLANTPSADALRSPTFQSMLRMRKSNGLSAAQLACFISPRPEEELYDLENDPFELHNLANDPAYEGQLSQLRAHMEEIRSSTEDMLPAERTFDEFTRDTGKPLPNRIRPRPSKAEMQNTK